MTALPSVPVISVDVMKDEWGRDPFISGSRVQIDKSSCGNNPRQTLAEVPALHIAATLLDLHALAI